MLSGFFSFDTFLFPRIVRLVYILGLVLIGLSLIGGLLGGLAVLFAETVTGLVMIVTTLIGAALGAIVWRLIVELWLVIFSINDNLKAIRDRGGM